MEGLHGCIPSMNWDSNDLTGAWKTFSTHIDFMFKGPLKEKNEEEKCAYLMIWVGERGREVYGTWTLTADEKKSLAHLTKEFEDYVKPKTNSVFNRYKFQLRVQENSESIDSYVTNLKLLAKDCDYENQEQNLIRDRIVFGVRSDKIREKLISEGSTLTLEKAIDISRSYEMSQKQMKTMTKGDDANINVVRPSGSKSGKQEKLKPQKKVPSVKRKDSSRCKRCGYEHEPMICPAWGKTCKECHKKNHFAKMCLSKQDKKVHEVEEEYDFGALYVGSLKINPKKGKRHVDKFMETLDINGEPITFQLDTGARCNVLSRADYNKLRIRKKLQKADVALRSFSGHRIVPEGMMPLNLKCKGRCHDILFYIVNNKCQSVLSGEAAEEIGLIKRINQVESEFQEVFEGLGCLPGEHTLKIDPSVPPVVHPPRKVPITLKYKVKDELDRMVKLGVIVRQKDPTPWVNSMVTVQKNNGQIRLCIDPKDLNHAIQREHFPMKTIEEVVSDMPNAKIFSKLDATSGFWQLKLDHESSRLTTFNTPYGRYRFLRAPFGIRSIPEIFQRTMTEMVEGIEGCEVIVDDILVWGSDMNEHDFRLNQVLDRAKSYNLKLSESKCEFRKEEIEYCGHKLTKDGLKVDPSKVQAVLDMTEPKDKKELQTFLGFVTYLAKFMPNMSETSDPLRVLLRKDVSWHWEKEQKIAFEKLKELATNTPVLKYYDPKKELVLNVDSSSVALGAVLLQENQPVAYASRSLTSTQKKYSQLEKETLAIMFGCEKFHNYLFGRSFVVESDHKPLEQIFKKSVIEAPPRIQRFAMSLQKYDLEVIHKPGKSMYISDALSRLCQDRYCEKVLPELEINEVCFNSHLPMSPKKYHELQNESVQDSELNILKTLCENGWPKTKNKVPLEVRTYWQFRHDITCVDNILFKGYKVIIPGSKREEMLKLIHESHLGIVKCKARAREFLYWPGMISQIQERVEKCEICALNNKKANHKEPMIPSPLPNRPSSKIGADLFELKGQHYLLTVDYYSKWPEVEKLDGLETKYVIAYLKKQISRFGYFDEIVTDNGPQFSSLEFKRFAEDYNFIHSTSSPHYSQSNGQTERFVQTVKSLLKKSNDPYKALLDYRNTPLEGIMLSPAQLHIGRRLKSSLPTTAELLKPQQIKIKSVMDKLSSRQQRQKYYYDQKAGERYSELSRGQKVIIQHNKQILPGKVIEAHEKPRSYYLRTNEGRILRRNRGHIKPTKAEFTPYPDLNDNRQSEVVNQNEDNLGKGEGSSTENQHSQNKSSSESVSVSAESSCQSSHVQPQNVHTRSGRLVKVPDRYKDFDLKLNSVNHSEVFV